MHRVLAIAWREFKHTALTKAFLIGGVILPIVFYAAMIVIIPLIRTQAPPLAGTIALVDPTGVIAPAVEASFDPEGIAARTEAARATADRLEREMVSGMSGDGNLQDTIDEARSVQEELAALQDEGVDVQVEISRLPDDIDMDVLKDQVSSGALLAAARFDPRLLDLDPSVTGDDASAGDGSEAADEEPARIELYTAVDIRPAHSRIIKRRIAESVVEARADRHDIDLERMRSMLREPSFASRSITEAGEETADTEVLNEVLPFAFMFLMWLAAFMSGQYLITTTIEEKSNRVMEVLLSAVSPMQIMTGKILGQGLVAVVPLTMYGGVGIGALVAFATVDVIEPFHLVCFFAYFVIAYLLFASIMAALGSAVNDLHEAQSLMGPVMVVVGFAPWLLMFPAREDPNGLVATIGSFIPPVTPYVMMIRITAGEVPAWQIPATMALGFVAVGFCLWAASKVFRIGVLMTGKPPSFLELARWVRYR